MKTQYNPRIPKQRMSTQKEWNFKALMPTVTSIIFEYADCKSMKLQYHDHLLFSVVGDNFFPSTQPLNCWSIRAHYGQCCLADDPECFRTEFLEEYHPYVHMYVDVNERSFSFIEWLKELGDVDEEVGEDDWPT